MPRLIALCLGFLLLGLGLADPAWAQRKKIGDLLKGLDSNDPQTRIKACEEIGQLAAIRLAYAKMALPQLRAILAKDSDAKVRIAALAALGKTEAETKDYIANMLKYFKEDQSYEVQQAALGLLAEYAEEAAGAVGPLKERLAGLRKANPDQDPGEVRAGIIDVLVQIDQDLNIPLVIAALKEDKAVSVKLSVLERLRRAGEDGGAKETAPVLIETYQASLQQGPSPQLRRGLLETLAVIEPAPKRYLPLVMETLKKDKDQDAGEVVAVVAALRRAGQAAQEAVPFLLEIQKAAAKAIPQDGGDPNELRKALLEGLVQLGADPKELAPLLSNSLKTDGEVGVRAAVLAGLIQLGDKAKQAIPIVAQLQKEMRAAGAKEEEDPNGVRALTLEALASLGVEPKRLVPELVSSAQRDRNANVRLTAVRLLGKIGPPAKAAVSLLTRMQRLSKGSGPEEREIAKAAAEALQKIKGK